MLNLRNLHPKPSSRLGVAVIGPGWVAGEHLKAWLANPYTELKAIVLSRESVSQMERARAYVRQYGLGQVRIERDLRHALEKPDIDVVSVCSINCFHFEQACEALRQRIHLLLEKPMCFNERELSVLRKLHRESGVKAMVSHVVRYYPALREIHRIARSGRLGDIYYIEADYWHEVVGAWKSARATGGSSLLMGGCHALDMMFHMLGFEKEVAEVSAFSAGPRRRKDFEYDPTVAALLRFTDGTLGKIGSSLESSLPYKFHLQIMGTQGVVVDNRLYLMKNGKKGKGKLIPGIYADDGDVAHHPFNEMINEFVEAIRKDREPPVSFEKSFKTYAALFALERSMKSGKPEKVK